MFIPAEIIKKKRNGLSNSKEEIEFLVNSFTNKQLPEYQMSAWLMAVFFKGMTSEETHYLTQCMLNSGTKFPRSPFAVDKHSTGGVGDKTSLILAPIVAAAGLKVPMISGRGLGHTGGTVDKLESIPGFNPQIDRQTFFRALESINFAMISQTEDICPADKRIYGLRDVTATVESLPLICASIMSKKLAEGISGLVLDVKFGSGAFMKTLEQAKDLAQNLIRIGEQGSVKTLAFLTNMSEPLGRFVGNSLEVEECLAILKNEGLGRWQNKDFEDTRQLSLELAGAMIYIGGKAKSTEEGTAVADRILKSGAAYTKFVELCSIHGGKLENLPKPGKGFTVKSSTTGHVQSYNCEQVGISAIMLGAGRFKSSDIIEPTAGIEIFKKIGDKVEKGDALFTIYGKDEGRFAEVEKSLLAAVQISPQVAVKPRLIEQRLGR